MHVDLYDGQVATGLELLVQLKSSQNGSTADFETIRLAITTYNYLWDKLQVVMLIKYIESENKAYWILLNEVPAPDQNHDTFTIRIPKENDLELLDWPSIYGHVSEVTNLKLAVRQRGRHRRVEE